MQMPVLSTEFELVMKSVVRVDKETVPELDVLYCESGCPGTLYVSGMNEYPWQLSTMVNVKVGMGVYLPVNL